MKEFKHYEFKYAKPIDVPDEENYICPLRSFLNVDGIGDKELFKFIDIVDEELQKSNSFDPIYIDRAIVFLND